MSDIEIKWIEESVDNGWQMPSAAWWKRLPIIRHLRYYWGLYQVEVWYSAGLGQIGLRTGYDEWVLVGIWFGWDGPPKQRDLDQFNDALRRGRTPPQSILLSHSNPNQHLSQQGRGIET